MKSNEEGSKCKLDFGTDIRRGPVKGQGRNAPRRRQRRIDVPRPGTRSPHAERLLDAI